MEPQFCFIREKYFEERTHYVKMLDSGNTGKQSKRTHIGVMIDYNGNAFYIPLRNNLGAEVRKFGRIGHAVPSVKRKDAGLDYRYALIVNDVSTEITGYLGDGGYDNSGLLGCIDSEDHHYFLPVLIEN